MLRHLTTVLFLVLAGLADGLAPKERRYALARFAPTTWVPRFLSTPIGGARREFSCIAAAMLTAPAARCARDRGAGPPCSPGRRGLLLAGDPGDELRDTSWASRALHDRGRHRALAEAGLGRCSPADSGRQPYSIVCSTSVLGRLAARRGSGRPCRPRWRRRACGRRRSARRTARGRLLGGGQLDPADLRAGVGVVAGQDQQRQRDAERRRRRRRRRDRSRLAAAARLGLKRRPRPAEPTAHGDEEQARPSTTQKATKKRRASTCAGPYRARGRPRDAATQSALLSAGAGPEAKLITGGATARKSSASAAPRRRSAACCSARARAGPARRASRSP